MRFNEKWAEYGLGEGPLQVRLLEKKSVLSNEAIDLGKWELIPNMRKN